MTSKLNKSVTGVFMKAMLATMQTTYIFTTTVSAKRANFLV